MKVGHDDDDDDDDDDDHGDDGNGDAPTRCMNKTPDDPCHPQR